MALRRPRPPLLEFPREYAKILPHSSSITHALAFGRSVLRFPSEFIDIVAPFRVLFVPFFPPSCGSDLREEGLNSYSEFSNTRLPVVFSHSSVVLQTGHRSYPWITPGRPSPDADFRNSSSPSPPLPLLIPNSRSIQRIKSNGGK